MKKKPRLKYDNVLLVIFVSIFVIFLIITGVMVKKVIKDLKGKKAPSVEVVDHMKEYDYQLTGSNTDYFKKLYYELKDLLNKDKKENFDEEYAMIIAKLFVADFYDLDSKLDKTDVGGVQFIWKDSRESFKNFATDREGMYYYIENNVYGGRTQKLPSVKEVSVDKIETIHYAEGGVEDKDAYQVELSITYQEDLKYPKNCTLILIHRENKIEVIDVK